MKRAKRGKGFLTALLLSVILTMTGCQTAAVQESVASEEEGASAPEASDKAEEETSVKDTEEPKEDASPAYMDAAYIEEHYEEEDEDLSRYRTSDTQTADSSKDASESTDDSLASSTEDSSASVTGTKTEEEGTTSEDDWDGDWSDWIEEQGGSASEVEPVDEEDAEIDTDVELSCTLFVECGEILNNIEDLTEGKEDLVPSDGVIYGAQTVTFYKGESVYDVLLREMQDNRIHMEASFTPAYNSAYIEGIQNLYEKDCGKYSGWMYCVNGWYPNYGCSRYQLKDGDVVEWHYTCDLGRDLDGTQR